MAENLPSGAQTPGRRGAEWGPTPRTAGSGASLDPAVPRSASPADGARPAGAAPGGTGTGPLLAAEEVSVAHGRRRVLTGVSLSVAAGERVAIVGPNGAGKTTLLRTLAGLAAPAGGTVRLHGRDISRLRERERARHLAFVAQDEHTDLPYRARDVLLLGRTAGRGDWHRYDADDHAVVTEVAEQWDLAPLLDRTLDALSGGERRRVLLARAFAQRAEALLLDEPTNHLDLRHQHALLAHLRDTGATTVLTLHDLDLAAAYSTRVVVIDRGEVRADGPPRAALTPERVAGVYGVPAEVVHVRGRARLIVG